MILRFKQFEGKYDKISGVSVDQIWKIIKITRILYNLKDKLDDSEFQYDDCGYLESQVDYSFDTPVEFDLFVRIKREKIEERGWDKLGFFVDGGSDGTENEILVTLIIDPDKEPSCYNSLNSYLQDLMRHEIEHLTHEGINRIEDRPDAEKTIKIRKQLRKERERGSYVNLYKYYTLEDEIGPLVQGMYRKAKTDKKPITAVFNEFLDIMEESEIINSDKRKFLFDAWTKEAKRLLPNAKY